jgi:hypothetical protein
MRTGDRARWKNREVTIGRQLPNRDACPCGVCGPTFLVEVLYEEPALIGAPAPRSAVVPPGEVRPLCRTVVEAAGCLWNTCLGCDGSTKSWAEQYCPKCKRRLGCQRRDDEVMSDWAAPINGRVNRHAGENRSSLMWAAWHSGVDVTEEDEAA